MIKIDMDKRDGSHHPDIKTDIQYLVKVYGQWLTGHFFKQHYGWCFLSYGASFIQLDGIDEVYEVDFSHLTKSVLGNVTYAELDDARDNIVKLVEPSMPQLEYDVTVARMVKHIIKKRVGSETINLPTKINYVIKELQDAKLSSDGEYSSRINHGINLAILKLKELVNEYES